MPKAKPKAGGKGKGLKGALGGKLMGIPVWAWVLAIGGGLLVGVYLRRRSAGQPTVTFPTPGLEPSPTDGGGGGGGGGTNLENALAQQNADFLAGLASLFAGSGASGGAGGGYAEYQPPGYPDYGAAPAPAPASSGPSPAVPSSPYTVGTNVYIPTPHLTQAAGGAAVGGLVNTVLRWGGKTFTDQAAFRRWTRAHPNTGSGWDWAQFQAKHPAAFTIFSALPKGTATTKPTKPKPKPAKAAGAK